MSTTTDENYKAMHKAVIFDALATMGHEELIVGYSGSGDSGQIDGMWWDEAYRADGLTLDQQVKWTRTQTSYHLTPDGMKELAAHSEAETSLRECIEEFCYGALYDNHAGWENNDGGEGEFAFRIADRTATLSHREFFTESNEYEHDL